MSLGKLLKDALLVYSGQVDAGYESAYGSRPGPGSGGNTEPACDKLLGYNLPKPVARGWAGRQLPGGRVGCLWDPCP
jgi:hypothetical protein